MGEAMEDTHAKRQERTDKKSELLRELPGLHWNAGEPCYCGVEYLSTMIIEGFSDSLVFSHTCTECGGKFSTWVEG